MEIWFTGHGKPGNVMTFINGSFPGLEKSLEFPKVLEKSWKLVIFIRSFTQFD